MPPSSSSQSTICPCHTLLQSSPQTTSRTGFCNTCINALLASKIAQHNAALEQRNIKRDQCAQTLTQLRSNGLSRHYQSHDQHQHQHQPSPRHQIESYQDQIRTLSSNIDKMRDECGRKSVSLASFSVIQSNRALDLDQKRRTVMQLRSHLDLLRSSVLMGDTELGHENLDGVDGEGDGDGDGENTEDNVANRKGADGNLASTIQRYVEQVKRRRFQLVLETFEMHRMDVGHEHKSLSVKDLLVGLDDDNNNSDNNDNRHERQQQYKHNDQKKQQDARFQKLVRQRIPSGIGKIGGLPLPHRGPSVYNKLLPTNVLTSSIRLIASLTNLLARCLSIELPHPIVLCPMASTNINTNSGSVGVASGRGRYGVRHEQLWLRDQTADIVECIGDTSKKDEDQGLTLMKDLERLDNNEDPDDCKTIGEDDIVDNNGTGASGSAGGRDHGHTALNKASMGMSGMSTSSLRSIVGSSSNLLSRAFDKMKGHHNHHDSGDKAPTIATPPQVPMDQDSVSLRLKYATHAIIYESNSRKNGSVVKYELRPPSSTNDLEVQRQEEEHFTIGLQLLQNDIIALSIQAGVPVQMLWPAEAMLLNLNSLKLYVMDLLREPHL